MLEFEVVIDNFFGVFFVMDDIDFFVVVIRDF